MTDIFEPSETGSETGRETGSEAEPQAAGGRAATAEALEAKIAEQAARLEEVLRAYSRLQQDNEDFRRRLERERDRVVEAERSKVALGLLEVVDELDRSLASAPPGTLVDGVRLIRDGLLRRALAGGITRQPVLGETFDPNLHEAVEMVACDRPEDDGRIVEEVRGGYRQGERLLRPAQVRVGRFAPSAAPPATRQPRTRGNGHRQE